MKKKAVSKRGRPKGSKNKPKAAEVPIEILPKEDSQPDYGSMYEFEVAQLTRTVKSFSALDTAIADTLTAFVNQDIPEHLIPYLLIEIGMTLRGQGAAGGHDLDEEQHFESIAEAAVYQCFLCDACKDEEGS